ncbi:hypothetical protein [Bosea sp. BK604]|uniref:hypothetical protein n=1 Tax=Bosea sp. BK604 TaxID=2512180 RepID=UPI001053BDEB|nr:hypothetical protein [Bosea sp. BK604]
MSEHVRNVSGPPNDAAGGSSSRLQLIAKLAGEGLSSREIAKLVGLSHSRVCRIARRHAIRLARSRSRHYSVYLPHKVVAVLRELAGSTGKSHGALICDCVGFVTEDGEAQARRKLGVAAQKARR